MKMLSKKKRSPASAEPAVSTPYTDAQHVWIERYGSYIQQAYNWRLIAMLLAVALTFAVFGLIYVSMQTKFVPYVVAIDKVGAAFAVFPADRASSVDQRVVNAELGRFIFYARTVTKDRSLQKTSLADAYDFVAPVSPAMQFLNDYYPKNDPFELAKTETVDVSVNNVLPVSPTTYEVQWTESIRSAEGNHLRDENWEAEITTQFAAVTDEAAMLRNPIGLYINALTWEKKL